MPAPLVVFGEDWGAHPSSTQHLVRELARERSVLWVNSIGLRRPRLDVHDGLRASRKLLAAARGLLRTGGGEPHTIAAPFPVVSPLAIPAASHRMLRRLNRQILAAMVGGAMRRHGLRRPVLWITLPTAVDVVGRLGEQAVIYYCCDDWSAMVGVDHDVVCRLEADLQARCDLVLAASPALAARQPPGKTVVVPHGVDAARFAEAQPRAMDFPDARPVAGFYGCLSEWIDIPLLARAARALPDWQFLLIGPVRTAVDALAALPNVRLAGPRRHEELPRYLQHWDVSLLPFRDTVQIRACNPLKLREYLAGGAPIVATDFPALDGYRDLVHVAAEPEAFTQAIRRAGAEGKSRRGERQARVAGESWQARARLVSELVDRHAR